MSKNSRPSQAGGLPANGIPVTPASVLVHGKTKVLFGDRQILLGIDPIPRALFGVLQFLGSFLPCINKIQQVEYGSLFGLIAAYPGVMITVVNPVVRQDLPDVAKVIQAG